MNTLASVFFVKMNQQKGGEFHLVELGKLYYLALMEALYLGGPRILGEGASNPVTINCTWHTVKCCERRLCAIQEKIP